MKKKLYQHRPQIAQANLCVINIEKGATGNGVTLRSIFPRNGTQQWHPSMAPSNGHPAMAPSNGIQRWAPHNGTQQWHRAMAPTPVWHPAMAPRQWHPAMAPNVNPAKVGSQPPLLLEVRTPIAKAIWGIIMSAMAASNGTQRELRQHPAMAPQQWHPMWTVRGSLQNAREVSLQNASKGSLRNAEPVFKWIIDLEVICKDRGLWVLESWQLEKRYIFQLIFLMWNVLTMAQKETCSAWMFPESSWIQKHGFDVGWACSCMSPFSSPLWPQNYCFPGSTCLNYWFSRVNGPQYPKWLSPSTPSPRSPAPKSANIPAPKTQTLVSKPHPKPKVPLSQPPKPQG